MKIFLTLSPWIDLQHWTSSDCFVLCSCWWSVCTARTCSLVLYHLPSSDQSRLCPNQCHFLEEWKTTILPQIYSETLQSHKARWLQVLELRIVSNHFYQEMKSNLWGRFSISRLFETIPSQSQSCWTQWTWAVWRGRWWRRTWFQQRLPHNTPGWSELGLAAHPGGQWTGIWNIFSDQCSELLMTELRWGGWWWGRGGSISDWSDQHTHWARRSGDSSWGHSDHTRDSDWSEEPGSRDTCHRTTTHSSSCCIHSCPSYLSSISKASIQDHLLWLHTRRTSILSPYLRRRKVVVIILYWSLTISLLLLRRLRLFNQHLPEELEVAYFRGN